MKLINPTLDELDAAFAEKVAGWKPICHCGDLMENHRYAEHAPVQMDEPIPQFTRSFDAVLPWLEKAPEGYMIDSSAGSLSTEYRTKKVIVYDANAYGHLGYHQSLHVAAVIALLRAHGVEVQFTKVGGASDDEDLRQWRDEGPDLVEEGDK